MKLRIPKQPKDLIELLGINDTDCIEEPVALSPTADFHSVKRHGIFQITLSIAGKTPDIMGIITSFFKKHIYLFS